MQFNLSASYTDLYEIAMGQALFQAGQHEKPSVFDYFFRKLPFGGGYAIFAGLGTLLEALEGWRFTAQDLDQLAAAGFDPAYIAYLKELRFRCSVHSVPEGEVVFPTEPLLRVEGSLIEAQVIETLLLNLVNYQSLVATRAARIRSVAGDAVLSEFGLRRAHGPGGILAARAAVVGGFDSTSNVYAAQLYGLKAEGTMAHSFVQWYDDELAAFRAFAEARPHNTVLLVDTYDTLRSGIPNAITVAREMRERGHRLRAVRLDSGDLAFFSRRARAMLDAAGLPEVKIVASNQLDEYVIRSLRQQHAPIDIYGVGTSLVAVPPDAALDGVYKLAVADGAPRLKVSESLTKTTLPGRKQVYRFFDDAGQFSGADGVALDNRGAPGRLIHPFESYKTMSSAHLRGEPLLHPVMKHGRRIGPAPTLDEVRQHSAARIALLPAEFLRFENPHTYKVGLSEDLHVLREHLRLTHKPGTPTT
ncbi:MAG: nicotinate phosphoribosyltransferase [Gemmatimonadaceae bacterium]|nr:nicotinate phosphoribosyltransferase [Gemmatimonadaceae bacterium]